MKRFFSSICVTFAMIAISNGIFAQGSRNLNSVYAELGGNTPYYSVNYERLFPVSDKNYLTARVGMQVIAAEKSRYDNVSIPLEVSWLWRKDNTKSNYLETGLGYTLIGVEGRSGVQNPPSFAKIGIARLGFRHMKNSGGLMYRLGLVVPLLQDTPSKRLIGDYPIPKIFGGVSLGYNF